MLYAYLTSVTQSIYGSVDMKQDIAHKDINRCHLLLVTILYDACSCKYPGPQSHTIMHLGQNKKYSSGNALLDTTSKKTKLCNILVLIWDVATITKALVF